MAVSSLSTRVFTMVLETGPFLPANFLRKPQLISCAVPSGKSTGADNVGRIIRVSPDNRSVSIKVDFTMEGNRFAFGPIW